MVKRAGGLAAPLPRVPRRVQTRARVLEAAGGQTGIHYRTVPIDAREHREWAPIL